MLCHLHFNTLLKNLAFGSALIQNHWEVDTLSKYLTVLPWQCAVEVQHNKQK